MSNVSSVERHIVRKVLGQPTTDGAGVRMTRIIGTDQCDHFDPFLLLDEFRSDNPDDYIAGFPDHPHRGFETVTYMLAGSMQHADNQGNTGLLGPGSLQWMTAGRGIVHSELPQQQDGLMWGFQLWVNLPASDKMTAPRYQDLSADRIPEVRMDTGVTTRVLAGHFAGATGPVEGVLTDPLYLDVTIAANGTVCIPLADTHNAFVYCFDGVVDVGSDSGTALARGEMGLLGDGARVQLNSRESARCLVVAGLPLKEPVARYGPFVMNSREELEQAFVDFRSGRF